jgi:ATP-dependent Lon protease
VDSPTSSGLRDIAPALDALPLFPLSTVLFPGALLPLHIFEPRYRAMIRDVLDGHGALAVVLVTDPHRLDQHGHPEIAKVAGAGVIIDHVELPSGRFNILVRGRARVSLDEIPFQGSGKPYRRARATVIDPPPGAATPSELSALVSSATAFAARVRERESAFDLHIPKDAPAGVVADLCAHNLVLDARERQAALETLDVGARVRRVTEVIALQRLALNSDPRDLN